MTFCLMIVAVVTQGTSTQPTAFLTNWRFDPATNQLEVSLEHETTPHYFILTQPPRIVLDLPNTQLGKVATQQNYLGAVVKVRVSQFQKDVTRIVLELSPLVDLTPERVQLQRVSPIPGNAHPDWQLRFLSADLTTPPLERVDPSPSKPQALTLPSATFGNQVAPVVSVPPLLTQPNKDKIIEFGQPLPTATTSMPFVVVPPLKQQLPDVLLPAATQLRLRYAGGGLTLKAGSSQQEVLLLDKDVFDSTGNAIAPAGTPVFGRFETDRHGSHFIAQKITLQGRRLPLAAKSDLLTATYLLAPTPVTLKPGQILQIRLTEALHRF